MSKRAGSLGRQALSGLPVLAFGLVCLMLLWRFPGTALGVSIFDLVQDTPAVRQKYRMEIVGFSTESGTGSLADESPASADNIWLSREKYAELGETEKADTQLEALINWRLERGRNNLVPYAVVLIREAFRESDSGNPARAGALIGYALRLAPDYPAVYLAQGYLSLKKSRLAVPAFLQGVASAVRAYVREGYHLAMLIGRAGGILVIVLLMATTIWMVSLLLRYATYLSHDLEEFYGGRRAYSGRRRLGMLLVLVVPLIVFASPLWMLVVGMFVSWAYQSTKEKAGTVIMTVLIALLPLLSWLLSSSLLFLGDELNQSLLAFRNGSENAAQALVLERNHDEQPGDATVTFSLAQHFWRVGKMGQSEELYRSLRASDGPLKLPSVINLGNILMVRGDLEGAATLYREAVALNPDAAGAHYNLGQVLNLQFKFKEGEEEIKRAMALDKLLILRKPTSSAGGTPLQALVTESLPLQALLGRLFQGGDFKRLSMASLDMWPLALSGVPARFFPFLVGAIALFGIFVSGFRRRQGLTKRCAKCGRPFCLLCLPGGGKSTLCPQCQHIFLVKEGIESSMRVEKMMEIKAYQTRKKRLGLACAALLPGGGYIFYGRPLLGLGLAFMASLTSVLVLGWHGPFTDRYQLAFPWGGFQTRAALVFFALVYLVNLAFTYRIGRGGR